MKRYGMFLLARVWESESLEGEREKQEVREVVSYGRQEGDGK